MRLSLLPRLSLSIAAFCLLSTTAAAQVSSSSSLSSAVAGLTVSVTDNKTTIRPGDTMFYAVTLKNSTSTARVGNVDLFLHDYANIVSPQNGGIHTGNRVRWDAVTLNAQQEYIFIVQVSTNPVIPNQTELMVKAAFDGMESVDRTTATMGIQGSSASSSSSMFSSSRSSSSSSRHLTAAQQNNSSRRSSRGSSVSNTGRSLLFSKTANTHEIVPGGRIRYTLYVQNVLLHTINDAVIVDRFDPQLLRVVDAGNATIVSEGQLQWRLPELSPGETWEETYILLAADSLPSGTQIGNIATISGDDVAYAALHEKVGVVQTGVVNQLPSTGAAYDVIFLFLTGGWALAFATIRIRR